MARGILIISRVVRKGTRTEGISSENACVGYDLNAEYFKIACYILTILSNGPWVQV